MASDKKQLNYYQLFLIKKNMYYMLEIWTFTKILVWN